MQVLIIGSGKLASELLNDLMLTPPLTVRNWSSAPPERSRSICIHAGSGRELDSAIAFCRETNSILIELATGSGIENITPTFPVILCPNTNILMLKFMNMLANSGKLFAGYAIKLTESHQAEKSSTPGTAVAIAQSLGLQVESVISVRDRADQVTALHIPQEHLDRHAVHSIKIENSSCSVLLETRVYGSSPYADGVSKIVSSAVTRPLENRVYAIGEFIEKNWV